MPYFLRSSPSAAATSSAVQHTGYFLIASGIDIAGEYEKCMIQKNDEMYQIFNSKHHNDHRRLQVPIKCDTLLTKIIQVAKLYFPGYVLADPVILFSVAGCKEQRPHTDYNPYSNYTMTPWGMIFAIEPDGAQFVVWPYSHKIIRRTGESFAPPQMKRTVINLSQGDVLFFRGDLVHAGASYDRDNMRIHAYIDPPFLERNRNETFDSRDFPNKDLGKTVDNEHSTLFR